MFAVHTFASTPEMLKETVTLQRGSIFEIATDIQEQGVQHSWVFSHNGTFLEAKRSPAFRTRLIEAGTYSLNAEVADANAQNRQKMILTIQVPETGGPSSQQATATQTLVTTNPASDAEGRIITEKAQHIIQLSPVNQNTTSLKLDLNTDLDSDRDGDTTNDDDVQGTFFGSKRTPIFLWLTNAKPQITITGQLSDGSVITQSVRVMSRNAAEQEDESTRKRVEIVAQNGEEGVVSFSVNYENTAPSGPVLYHWNFGDGRQSLLDSPVHTYAENGTFTVNLTVRNLETGEITEEVRASVQVNNITDLPTEKPTDTEDSGKSMFALFGLIIKILAIALASLLVGLGVVFAIAKLRNSSSLHEKIEMAEKKLVGDTKEEAPPPLEVIEAEEVPPPVEEKKKSSLSDSPNEFRTKPKKKEEPQIEQDPEPATIETPTSEIEPPESPTIDNGAKEPLPDWLQPAATPKPSTPPQVQETPKEEPIVVQTPEPPAPMPVEKPALVQEGPVPDWLNGAKTKESATEATTPPPPPLAEEPVPEMPAPVEEMPTPPPTTTAEAEQSAPPPLHEQGATPPWLQASASEPEVKKAPPPPPPPQQQQQPKKNNQQNNNQQKKKHNNRPPQKPQGQKPPEKKEIKQEKPKPEQPSVAADIKPEQPSVAADIKPEQPSVAATPEKEEEPIAFIRAESIDEQNEQPKAQDIQKQES